MNLALPRMWINSCAAHFVGTYHNQSEGPDFSASLQEAFAHFFFPFLLKLQHHYCAILSFSNLVWDCCPWPRRLFIPLSASNAIFLEFCDAKSIDNLEFREIAKPDFLSVPTKPRRHGGKEPVKGRQRCENRLVTQSGPIDTSIHLAAPPASGACANHGKVTDTFLTSHSTSIKRT